VDGPLTVWILRRRPAPRRPVLVVESANARVPSRASADATPTLDVEMIAGAVARWRHSKRVAESAEAVLADELLSRLGEAVRPPESRHDGGVDAGGLVSRGEQNRVARENQNMRVAIQNLAGEAELVLDSLWQSDQRAYWRLRDRIESARRLL
jgi:hypothetical protein